MATVEEIKITNCGPVEKLSIPCPADGGLIVLKGRNGRGKSLSLGAVDTLVTGRGKIDVRDGALSGSVEAFGVNIKVGRKTTRAGELEVTGLDGRLDVSVLVDPLIKSPDAADAKRIKALVQLANVAPSPELFYDLFGGREGFEAVVGTAATSSDDLVVMAERIKRDAEAAARMAESQAEHAEGRANGCREAAAGVDVAAECDPEKLQSALESAIRHEAKLRADSDSARTANRNADAARDALEDAEAMYKGPGLAACREAEERAKAAAEMTDRQVREAEELLRRVQAERNAAHQDYQHAVKATKAAEEHEKLVAKWREQLKAAVPAAPSEEMLSHAAAQVTAARQAVENAAIVRKAKAHLATADEHLADAQKHRQAAAKLRDAAGRIDDVLSEVVGRSGTALRVEAGRLVLDTKRGATYFADLSHGERWRIALDIAIDAFPKESAGRCLLVIPQEAYEGLDVFARQAIHEHLVTRRVVALTAESSADDEIVAEEFSAVG